MTESRFERLYAMIRRRRVAVLLLLACAVVAAVAAATRLRFETSVEVMLPDGDTRDAIKFLTQASLADKVVLSLERIDSALGDDDFIRAADQLSERLRSPHLAPFDTGAAASGMLENFNRLLRFAPQLFGPEDLAKAREALEPGAIDKAVRSLYEELARPSSLFTGKLARQDPLGISRAILGRIERLSEANLYDVTLEQGHLFSRDRNHLLLVFSTPVSITDSAGARLLVAHLDAQCATLPPSLRADVVCGHLHTASNERIIRRDIARTSWIGAVAFFIIFAVVFRDWRSVAMLAIPTCAALVALPLAAIVHAKLSYLVAGFGMVIIGITSDYGIYVYVVTKRSARPAQAVRRIVRPIGLGMLTTLCVFFAFYFSGIEGYRQLATFAIISIVLAWLAAIFILPHLLKTGTPEECVPEASRLRSGRPTAGTAVTPSRTGPVASPSLPTYPGRWAAATGIALAVGLLLILQARFNTDVTLLDGTDRSVLDAEARFEKTWSVGGDAQGVLAVTGATYEEALRRSETISDRAAGQLGHRLLSFTTLWRSEASRAENLARWTAFWTPDQMRAVKARLAESGKRYGFTEAAFQPFFDQLASAPELAEPDDNALFEMIKDRFVHRSADGYTIYSFFPDTPEGSAIVRSVARDVPGSHCISRRLLAGSLAASVGRTVSLVSIISLLLVAALTLLLSPTWRSALIALAPSAIGVLFSLGIPSALGHTLNICHLTAAAVVFGLCVDYGIYMAHAISRGITESGKATIVLTTATSVIGAGVLLFTQHPMLFAIGITLTAGMLAGHFAAVWSVPALVALCIRAGHDPAAAPSPARGHERPERGGLLKPLILVFLSHIAWPLAGHAAPHGGVPPVTGKGPARYEALSSVVFQYRWLKFPALGMISVDTRNDRFALVGLSQMGLTVFELSDRRGNVTCRMPGPLLKRNPELASGAARDVKNLFFNLVPSPAAKRRETANGTTFTDHTPEGIVEYRFDRMTGLLAEKRFSVPRRLLPGRTVVWRVNYEDYAAASGKCYPKSVRFKNRQWHYAVSTRVREMRVLP
jgi:predicted exporter